MAKKVKYKSVPLNEQFLEVLKGLYIPEGRTSGRGGHQ